MALVAFLLHLGQHVANDATIVVLCHVEKLWPREDVVEVVLHLVVLREAEQIAGLHGQQVVYSGLAYAHHGCLGVSSGWLGDFVGIFEGGVLVIALGFFRLSIWEFRDEEEDQVVQEGGIG